MAAAARAALDGGEYMKALKACKGVLAAEKDNYDALCIAGEACSHLLSIQLADVASGTAKEAAPDWMEQSEKAFTKACEAEPLRIEAWKGLATLLDGQGEKLTDAMVGMYRAMQASGMAEWADECAKAAARMEGEKRFGKSAEAFADLAANSGDAAGKISAMNSRARVLRTGDLPGCQQASSEAVACWLSDKACAPPDAECFHEAADSQASKGDYSAAWGGIKAHPTHLACYDVLLSATWADSAPEGLWDIGGSGSSREGSSGVEKLAARAAMSHPGSARAWIRIGAAMNGRGRHARARPLLEAWAKKAPQDAGSWLALGDAYVNTGAPKSALKCAAKSAECAASCSGGGVSGVLRASKLLSAECLVRQRNFDEARQEFSKVLADDPSSLKALDGMGRACASMGDRASARDYFGQVLSADPLNHGVFSRLADLCGEEGRWAKAANYMKQAADIAPSNAAYRYGLGRSRWMQGGQVRSGRGAASAFPELLAAVKLDPNMARAWTLLGHYYKVEAKDSERAKRVYAKALSLDPADAEAGEALCAMHISAGQAGLVMAACEDAISASTTAAWAHLRKGTLLLRAGRADDAAAPLQAAIRFGAEGPPAWAALGRCYEMQGRLEPSIQAYERALELGNGAAGAGGGGSIEADCKLRIALIRARMGLAEQAVAELQALHDMHPTWAVSACALGDALYSRALQSTGNGAYIVAHAEADKARALYDGVARANPSLGGAWKRVGDSIMLRFSTSTSKRGCAEQGPRLRLAKAAYARAIMCRPWQSGAWHDLAAAAGCAARAGIDAVGCAERAAAAAVALSGGTDPAEWETLGSVCGDEALKEHCHTQAALLSPANGWPHLHAQYARLATAGSIKRNGGVAQNLSHSARQAVPGESLPFLSDALIELGSSSKPPSLLLSQAVGLKISPAAQICGAHAALQARQGGLEWAAHAQQCAPILGEADWASLNTLGLALEDAGRPREAIQHLKTALSNAGGNSDAVFQNLARNLTAEGRGEEAVSTARAVGASGLELGRAMAATGDNSGAAPVLRRAADGMGGHLGEGEALRLAVSACTRAGDRAGAAEAADRLVALGGLGGDAVRVAGEAVMGVVDMGGVLRVCRAAAETQVVDEGGCSRAAAVCMAAGATLQARRASARAVHQRPWCLGHWNGLASVLQASGRGSELTRGEGRKKGGWGCALGVGTGEELVSGMRLLGQGILSSRGGGGGERGVKAACALAHMRPWESSGWSILGGLITKRGGAKEAKMASRLLEKAVSLGGGAESACLLSEARLLSGDADRAMAEVGGSASQRGRCLMAMGKANEAVVEFKKAMASGKAGCVVEWMGSAYAATGDAVAAVACFERACEEAQASGDWQQLSLCLSRCAELHATMGSLDEQVDKLRRAQIIEREWKGAETEELKGALDAARKALKASRKV